MNAITLFHNDDVVCLHQTAAFSSDEISTRHVHDSYELYFVVEGKGRFFVEGVSYRLLPGSAMLVAPREYHAFTGDCGTRFDGYCLRFSDNMLNAEAKELLTAFMAKDGEHGSRFAPSLHVMQPLIGAFERFSDAEKLPQEKRILFAKSLLFEIMVLLSSSTSESMAPDQGELAVRVLHFLNERPGQNLSLDAIAKHFFVSKFYLCRAFKEYNGISIHEYLLQKRIWIAKQLIESGETASSAAYRVGFGDYSAFYRAYVKVTGSSPVFVIRKKG